MNWTSLLNHDFALFYIIIIVIGSVFLKEIWIKTDRNYTEKAEYYFVFRSMEEENETL